MNTTEPLKEAIFDLFDTNSVLIIGDNKVKKENFKIDSFSKQIKNTFNDNFETNDDMQSMFSKANFQQCTLNLCFANITQKKTNEMNSESNASKQL